MAVFALQDVSFAYQGSEKQALSHLSFTVEEGEFLLVCGASGCGKTTLLRLLKHLIAPAGRREGSLLYHEQSIDTVPEKQLAGEIGFVFQNVESQLVSDHVYHELAFGLENLGASSAVISSKVAETASFFGIERYFERRTNQLSGGEKQLLNLASVMVTEPAVLILDEPLSQLDPIARLDFLAQLRRVNQDLGVTVILCDHHLDEVFALCDRVVVLEQGKRFFCGAPAETAKALLDGKHSMACALPAGIRLFHGMGSENYPLDVKSARALLQNVEIALQVKAKKPKWKEKEPVLKCKQLIFGYERGKTVLTGVDFVLHQGQCTAVIGGNGAGKSTLLNLLAGNLKPQSGKVKRASKKVGYLPQNPYHSFICDTVEEDLCHLIQRLELSEKCLLEQVNQFPFFEGIQTLYQRNPLDLSGGEAQKIALLKLLITGADVLLLDEPTKGLDACAKEQLMRLMDQLKGQGISFVLASHDLDFVACCAEKCALLFRGEIAVQGATRDLLCANSFYTTSLRKITKGFVEGTVTLSDLEGMWS